MFDVSANPDGERLVWVELYEPADFDCRKATFR
jgi:hypothetical protein